MNYAKETLCNALAAEYVLGTLKGKARQRYETLMMENQTIRETTWLWEQHLNGMGEGLKPVQPPPSSLQASKARFAQSPEKISMAVSYVALSHVETVTRSVLVVV